MENCSAKAIRCVAQFPMTGCFATSRCKFAPGQEPEPPKSAPGGAADPLGLFREPAKPREVFIERTAVELSERDRRRIKDDDEVLIKEIVFHGIPADEFDKAIDPEQSEEKKTRIAKTVANSFSAVFKMKKPGASKVTLTSAAGDKSASDEAAAIAESIDTLRDALENAVPHRRVLTLRNVMPMIGQKNQITCPTHNAYCSRPGVGDPRKVIEDYYLDAAAYGKQYEVLELVEGDIGHAHYYAARVNIAKEDWEFEKPMMAYINIRVRFFEWDNRGVRKWTSGFNEMW